MNLEPLLNKKARIALVCTGAGAGLQSHLWNIPGISSVLVEASFPYAPESTAEYLGFKPEGFCSEETAIKLALAAYYRAYKPGGEPAIGVGLTASVASTRAHRGDHRAFAACFSDKGCQVHSIKLRKGVGPEQRLRDGRACDTLAAVALREAVGELWAHPKFEPDLIDQYDVSNESEWARELIFQRPFFSKTGIRLAEFPLAKYAQRGAIFPGAFNPPHEGHFGMAEAFTNYVGGPVAFNIEANPPHKGLLETHETLQRAKMLKGQDVILTNGLGLYVDKAKAFPGLGLLIGTDALARLLDHKWGPALPTLVRGFMEAGTVFYVVDRKVGNILLPLSHIDVPAGINCRSLSGRWDISSTDLRNHTTP